MFLYFNTKMPEKYYKIGKKNQAKKGGPVI